MSDRTFLLESLPIILFWSGVITELSIIEGVVTNYTKGLPMRWEHAVAAMICTPIIGYSFMRVFVWVFL